MTSPVLWAQAALPQSTPSLSASQQSAIERRNLLGRIADLEQEVRHLQIVLGQVLQKAEQVLAEEARQVLRQELERIKKDIEASNPGYDWDPATGAFTPKPQM